MDDTLAFSDMIFILVATPNGAGTNAYDHSTLSKVLDDINSRKVENKHLVICCTVMPGYIAKFGRYLIRDCPGCTLSYHPEFIAQGEIIKGLRYPDMVLIGEGSKDAGDVIEQMNHDCTENEPRMARMAAESAEITKLTVNCFVTTKISFANSIGDLADVTPGANKFDILGAVGADSRVGGKCLRPGYGFGGPCFPRDNRALGKYMEVRRALPLCTAGTVALALLPASKPWVCTCNATVFLSGATAPRLRPAVHGHRDLHPSRDGRLQQLPRWFHGEAESGRGVGGVRVHRRGIQA